MKRHGSFSIVGNWKMNPDTLIEARELFSSIVRKIKSVRHTTVIIAPPAPFIADIARHADTVHIAAQDISENPSGAFTGSISAREVKSSGAEYTLVGHSERRSAGDTNEIVARKAKEALDAGLRVIVCVGEYERDSHARYLRFIREQIVSVITTVGNKNARWITIAYEPVWAIGKGFDSAIKPADMHEMSIYIRKVAIEVLGKKIGMSIPILYGGSVDDSNARAILDTASVNGLLIGRESLDARVFADIVTYADSL